MSSPEKVTSPIVEYVHKLSNLKQGKKTRWCDMELQMKGDVIKRVVCFSKVKRDIFQANQETLSAVRISNYVINKSLTSESEDIPINVMTSVVAAGPSEYNFQYIPDQQPKIVSLNEVRRTVNIGKKLTVKGRIKKGEKAELVGAQKLQMLKSMIFDRSDNLYLTLWENEITSVSEGTVNVISSVNVRMTNWLECFQPRHKQFFLKLMMMYWRCSMILSQFRC